MERIYREKEFVKAAFFGEKSSIDRVYSPEQKQRLKKLCGCSEKVYSDNDLDALKDTGYLFSTWGMPVLSSVQIKEYLPSLKAVFYAAGSVQHFARPFLLSGVRVFSAWRANAVPVTECSVSQILLANKGFYYLARECKNDYAFARSQTARFPGNYGANVGILGDGAIGKGVIEELLRRDLNILVFSPALTDKQAENLGVRKASLEEIFEKCHTISNHLADNEKTKGIINAGLIAKLKSYSCFINTGRGAQIDESALIDKLSSDDTITAVLDVTFPEPPETGSKLYSLKNVVLTPHFAGSSGQEVQRMAQYMIDEWVRFDKKNDCMYEVTLDMLETMA